MVNGVTGTQSVHFGVIYIFTENIILETFSTVCYRKAPSFQTIENINILYMY